MACDRGGFPAEGCGGGGVEVVVSSSLPMLLSDSLSCAMGQVFRVRRGVGASVGAGDRVHRVVALPRFVLFVSVGVDWSGGPSVGAFGRVDEGELDCR